MRVHSLHLKQYRNINELTLQCQETLHFFVGANAQGKTNILESLYVLGMGKSHRSRTHKELIQFGKESAQLQAQVVKGTQKMKLSITLTEKGKKVSRNGIEQTKLSHYIGSLPIVLFAPEDLSIVKGSPQVRRRFLDMEIGQVSPAYIHYLTQYNKLVSQRNSLLKQLAQKKSHPSLLTVINEQLISLACEIWFRRFRFLISLQKWAQEIHQAITQQTDELVVKYVPSVKLSVEMKKEELAQVMEAELAKVMDKEIQRGTTLVGPHRDDLNLTVGGIDLHTFGSQGQQRTAALSLKLAEIELIYHETGYYPILLLDDVLSELDDQRKTHLLESIKGRVQTFVTTTSLDGIDPVLLQQSKVYQVKQGIIMELE
ncbi:DNA replication/repair protein RecF [Hazenella sp. IB182357]|uniref:DNA replication and repair protein RecF n=1 Tax=Polycladospora coralii TaxID=2771432 RepID=A0A926RU55_9BACL|nr:DNA replication/repair protein RecF [Polycladospora coralii]MBD1371969.1 DNA replication/repair protein RecF [Polycladospora coralii]MBS7530473.1 DNA replication/repair protein RecF [Polycladospora coralii]